MPVIATDPEDSAKSKPYHTSADQPTVTHIAEQLSGSSISTDVAFVAELDSTPIRSRKASVVPPRAPSRAPTSDVTVDDASYGDCEMLTGEKPAAADIIEQVAKTKAAKMKDPAVLINLPTSPSAQAYEVARDAKKPGDEGYFDPAYADTDDRNGPTNDNGVS